MLPYVEQAIEEIRRAFAGSALTVEEDGGGGAYVIVESVDLGERYRPNISWMGGHLSPQLPYADVYPLYIGGDIERADQQALQPPITRGHQFRGRAAVQVSRRTNRLDPQVQTPVLKFQKVLHYLRCQV